MLTRVGGATGLIYFALVLFGFVIPQPPVGDASGQQISAYLAEHHTASLISALHVGLSTLVFFWFAGTLRVVLRPVDGPQGYLSALSFGGASVVFAMVLMVTGISLGLTTRVPKDPVITEALWQVSRSGFVLIGFPAAAFAGAASILMLRSQAIWRWLGVIGFIAALLELVGTLTVFGASPIGFLGFALLALWISGTSLVLILAGPPGKRRA
jgi:hypothetical protein